MYVYSIIYLLILITSPTTILNFINLLCPLDTALVLTSDDFHSIFPPSPPLLPPSRLVPPLVVLFRTLTWRRLYHVFTYIYSLLIEKYICDCQNISIKLPCVCFVLNSLHFFNKEYPLSFPFSCSFFVFIQSFKSWIYFYFQVRFLKYSFCRNWYSNLYFFFTLWLGLLVW